MENVDLFIGTYSFENGKAEEIDIKRITVPYSAIGFIDLLCEFFDEELHKNPNIPDFVHYGFNYARI